MHTEPHQEHNWLQWLVGDWTFENEAAMGPGEPPMKSSGTERVRSLGGLWVVCEGKGEMPAGSPAEMLMTIGYDPKSKRYTGTWIGSMMPKLWVYDGSLDAEQRVLTLESEGPSFTDEGKTARYRDVIEKKSDDHRLFTSHMLGEDGKWTQFMTAHYRRAK